MCAHISSIPRLSTISNVRSWDGVSFSFQSFDSTDGTISFDKDKGIVVGALRKNTSERTKEYPEKNALAYFAESDDNICDFANSEALQYLLMSFDQKKGFMGQKKPNLVVPVITTCFWNEDDEIYAPDTEADFIKNGGQFINELCVQKGSLVEWLTSDYELTADELEFSEKLFQAISNGKTNISKEMFSNIVNEDSDVYDDFVSALSSLGIEVNWPI